MVYYSYSFFEALSAFHDRYKFCIHFRSLNIHHFGMVEATGLKSVESRSAQWHAATTDCHESLLIGSTVTGGEGGDSHMDRQKNGDLTSLTFLFGERELKMFQAESVATFMVPAYIFHMPSSNSSLVIAMKPKAQNIFHDAANNKNNNNNNIVNKT
jgi:hypothetical protein